MKTLELIKEFGWQGWVDQVMLLAGILYIAYWVYQLWDILGRPYLRITRWTVFISFWSICIPLYLVWILLDIWWI